MIVWVSFSVILLIILIFDLGVVNKKPHLITAKGAAKNTLYYLIISLLLCVSIYWVYKFELVENPTAITPIEASIKYLTGYLVEFALSIDNIFVIALLFGKFSVPNQFQHKVLFWGILGAIVFRLAMILFGVALITKFHWTIYLFGGFLIFSGIKMLFEKEEIEQTESKIESLFNKVFKVKKDVKSGLFFIVENGKKYVTSLFLVLILIEFTDLIFALDSIPAIISITPDPFIVFTSNIMAILGLRSLFFFLSSMLDKFSYLKYSLVVILVFIGIKMILSHFLEIPEWISLAVVVLALNGGILFSLTSKKN